MKAGKEDYTVEEGSVTTRAQFRKLLSKAQRWTHPKNKKKLVSYASAVAMITNVQDRVAKQLEKHAATKEQLKAENTRELLH